MYRKENKMKNKITKCNKWLVGFALVATTAMIRFIHGKTYVSEIRAIKNYA